MTRGGQSQRSARAAGSVASGLGAERLAILWLALKGYRLIERRHGGQGGEIDLIVRRGRTIAFVEVKARAAMEDAQGAITAEKVRLLTRRINAWRALNPWAEGCALRADAVFIARGRWPRHVPRVFELASP